MSQTEPKVEKKVKADNPVSKESCPECGFTGDKKFPNGYAQEGNIGKHCPKCGFWKLKEKKGGN